MAQEEERLAKRVVSEETIRPRRLGPTFIYIPLDLLGSWSNGNQVYIHIWDPWRRETRIIEGIE